MRRRHRGSRAMPNADGRRENNVTQEEWREYRLLMKLMQMQL